MKHPVLHIKKEATVYDDFETQKEARRLLKPALEKLRMARPRRSRKRRAGLSTASLVVLAIGLYIVFRQVPHGEAPRATFAGWQVILRATPHGELIIVGATFIAEPAPTASGTTATGAATASVRVTLTGTDERLDLTGTLDRSPMTLRGELPNSATAKTVKAKVSIGPDRRTLWVAMPRLEKE